MKLRRILTFFILCIVVSSICPLVSLGETDALDASALEQVWKEMWTSPDAWPLATAMNSHLLGTDERTSARNMPVPFTQQPYGDWLYFLSRMREQGKNIVALLLAPEPYDEELAREEIAKTFEFIPIARDALVFLVSAHNPVQSITEEQLQKIYAGQIANWSEVGGQSEKIKAFQNAYELYSQKMMKDCLMHDKAMAEPPLQFVYTRDGEWISVNAGYDHSESALGYTMYFYTRGMYQSRKSKLLQVDGIAPNPDTIMSGKYPLTTNYYAVFPKSTPQDHPIRTLVAWLLTTQGQRVVQHAGYIPLYPTGGEEKVWAQPYAEKATSESSGSGGKEDRKLSAGLPPACALQSPQEIRGGKGLYVGCELFFVSPDEPLLEATVNAWCQNTRAELSRALSDIEITDRCHIYNGETSGMVFETAYLYGDLVSFLFTIGEGPDTFVRTAVFDLKTGRQLQLSDIFIDGFNYIEYINNAFMQRAFQPSLIGAGDLCAAQQDQKRPFSGIPADYPYFVITEDGKLLIGFQGMNPFFQPSNVASEFTVEVPVWHDVSPWGE